MSLKKSKLTPQLPQRESEAGLKEDGTKKAALRGSESVVEDDEWEDDEENENRNEKLTFGREHVGHSSAPPSSQLSILLEEAGPPLEPRSQTGQSSRRNSYIQSLKAVKEDKVWPRLLFRNYHSIARESTDDNGPFDYTRKDSHPQSW